jgi:hypothetical protein
MISGNVLLPNHFGCKQTGNSVNKTGGSYRYIKPAINDRLVKEEEEEEENIEKLPPSIGSAAQARSVHAVPGGSCPKNSKSPSRRQNQNGTRPGLRGSGRILGASSARSPRLFKTTIGWAIRFHSSLAHLALFFPNPKPPPPRRIGNPGNSSDLVGSETLQISSDRKLFRSRRIGNSSDLSGSELQSVSSDSRDVCRWLRSGPEEPDPTQTEAVTREL